MPTRPSWYVGHPHAPGRNARGTLSTTLNGARSYPQKKRERPVTPRRSLWCLPWPTRLASVAATGSAAMRLVGPQARG